MAWFNPEFLASIFVTATLHQLLSRLVAADLPPAGGIGVREFPLQAAKMYIFAMLAPSPPGR